MYTRVAIVAPFGSWTDTYSLCHVVREQYAACLRMGFQVDVFVGTGCAPDPRVPSRAEIPLGVLQSDRVAIDDHERAVFFFRELAAQKYDAIIFHDIILQSTSVTMAKAVRDVNDEGLFGSTVCLHYLHSRPVPDPKAHEARRTLPRNHFIIYPNGSNDAIEAVCGTYACDPRSVFAIINPCDPLEASGATEEVKDLLRHARWYGRSVVQTYPVCSTRFDAKGLRHLIRMFDVMRGLNENPLLIVCNAHANGRRERLAIDKLHSEFPIVSAGNVLFTSRLGYEDGVSRSFVQSLMRLSDVFIFPTASEAGPLGMLEAAAAGCFIAHNGGACPSLDYYAPPGSGSFHLPLEQHIPGYAIQIDRAGQDPVKIEGMAACRTVYNAVAREVLSRLHASPSYQARMFVKTEASVGAHGNALKQIITEARRIIHHEQPI